MMQTFRHQCQRIQSPLICLARCRKNQACRKFYLLDTERVANHLTVDPCPEAFKTKGKCPWADVAADLAGKHKVGGTKKQPKECGKLRNCIVIKPYSHQITAVPYKRFKSLSLLRKSHSPNSQAFNASSIAFSFCPKAK